MLLHPRWSPCQDRDKPRDLPRQHATRNAVARGAQEWVRSAPVDPALATSMVRAHERRTPASAPRRTVEREWVPTHDLDVLGLYGLASCARTGRSAFRACWWFVRNRICGRTAVGSARLACDTEEAALMPQAYRSRRGLRCLVFGLRAVLPPNRLEPP